MKNFKLSALPVLRVLLALLLPAYSLMISSGIHSMHDFHPFRLQQFISAGTFPGRWAPDAGAGYGEPVFNYYGQFVYWLGSVFYLLNFSILSSVKAVFVLSILLSSIFMFFLAKKHFGQKAGLISALFYTYAPYRAVDIWVRGALPEAFAFVFFPAILLSPNVFWMSLSIAGLIITHNLSALMFLPFAFIFSAFQKNTKQFIYSSIIALFLSSFYLIPLYWERNLVSLSEFTQDLYQYQLHFTTLKQLFVSNFWGYGSSVWGVNDNMSFSVGYLHWFIGSLVLLVGLFKKNKLVLLSSILGFLAIFLTHGKSEFIWKIFSPLSYLQFPWRFLSVSTFFLSLSVGFIAKLNLKNLYPYILVFLILLNANYFKYDYWIPKTDQEYFSGDFWNTQRFASLLDYWPVGSKLPDQLAPDMPFYSIGNPPKGGVIVYPIVNFPGWQAKVNNQLVPIINHSDQKLISFQVPPGPTEITLEFTDTLPRTVGNLTSLVSLIILFLCYPLLSRQLS